MGSTQKPETTFETNDVDALAKETIRLGLAGIKSYGRKCTPLSELDSVSTVAAANDSVIVSIANRVIEKLNINAVNSVSDPNSGAYALESPSDKVSDDIQVYFPSNNFHYRGRDNYLRTGRGQFNNLDEVKVEVRV